VTTDGAVGAAAHNHKGDNIMTITEARKQIGTDPFLQFAVRDIMKKGVDEMHAITLVLNTYGAKDAT
jgi:hypothetical protein